MPLHQKIHFSANVNLDKLIGRMSIGGAMTSCSGNNSRDIKGADFNIAIII